jgi:DNA-binding PadR family transcriptional regulator
VDFVSANELLAGYSLQIIIPLNNELLPSIKSLASKKVFCYTISVNDIAITDAISRSALVNAVDSRPEDLLPLTPAVFHILLALAGGERHGYDIMREVDIITVGKMQMGPGTLYGSIKRMLRDGLIAESDERPDPALDDSRRRYYQMTEFGRRVLTAESDRLASLVEVARRRDLLGPVNVGQGRKP